MKNYIPQNEMLFLRIIKASMGLFIIGFSIGVFLKLNIGVDPGSVLISGISKTFNTNYGNASLALNIILISIMFLIDKKYVHISSFLGAFVVGYSANFGSMVTLHIVPNIAEINIIFKFLVIFAWMFILSIGVVLYIEQNLGLGALDGFPELICDKFSLSYDKVRIVQDITIVTIGFLLGGQIGIGTLLCAILTGPMIKFNKDLYAKFIKNNTGD